MRKIIIGLVLGSIAGIIDVIPMVLQKLTWDANISAFSMWVIIGFFISTTELKMIGLLKGEIIGLLTVIPYLILIGWKDPFSILPITIMTVLLSGILGLIIEKLIGDKK